MSVSKRITVRYFGYLLCASSFFSVNNALANKTLSNSTLDQSRVAMAEKEPDNWLSHGRTYAEQRFSPMKSINSGTVKQLGLSWFHEFTSSRGKEATPLVVDGVLYVTGSWSTAYAFNAKNGQLLWSYDPKVPRQMAGIICCDAVNRGLAYWQGKLFLGALDGRLIALDADTGKSLWAVQTTPLDKPYSITGAPRVVKDKVIIGNGGAEMGVRGFVSAYDVAEGKLQWRFYTVPGNPANAAESPALSMAAKTWSGNSWWKQGGGGTVWDSMAYDPKNDLLYIGVGNGSPWSHQQRSEGQGDNLFLSSIVALRPETGEYVWHYQTTPKDSWDYTATQQMILADISIDGRNTPVIMQAPKKIGFFYVLNRLTGELISAEKYTHVTWASHVDLATGRPVENPDVHYGAEQAKLIYPGSLGGHNWHSMSFSPQTGLVYVPIHHVPAVYKQDKAFGQRASYWQTGTDWTVTSLPEEPAIADQALSGVTGKLLAWDPVAQQEVWSVAYPNVWNGGVLATAGQLIFQGSAEGEFAAFHAASGEKLWSFNAQGGMVAAPISYAVAGKQYVAILTGWGGAYPAAAGRAASRSMGKGMKSRLLVFALGDKRALPLLDREDNKVVDARFASYPIDPVMADKGKSLYLYNCLFCHGDGAVSASPTPDLRYMSMEKHTLFKAIVLDGLFSSVGMPSFKDRLTEAEVNLIQHYIVQQSQSQLQ